MFLGMAFLTLALCALLSSFGFDWIFANEIAIKFWPSLLVFLGAATLLRHCFAKTVLYGMAGCIAGALLYSAYIMTTRIADKVTAAPTAVAAPTQTFNLPYKESVKNAEFHFSGGAVSIKIGDTTPELVASIVESSIGDYSLEDMSPADSIASVVMAMGDVPHATASLAAKNKVEIKLNSAPVWDMNFEFGAAAARLDLRKYRIRSLNISCGASNAVLQLGDMFDSSSVNIEGGIMKMQIEVPDSAGCKIIGEDGPNSFSFDGFEVNGDEDWQTPNFDDAKRKIIINLDAGLSKTSVRRVQSRP